MSKNKEDVILSFRNYIKCDNLPQECDVLQYWKAIDQLGINKVIEMTLDAIKTRSKIHISFDIDSLDARVAPSTGTAVEGGLTLREGITILEALRATKIVEAFDLTEVNLSLGTKDDARATLSASFDILKAIFGHKRGGNSGSIKRDIFLEN